MELYQILPAISTSFIFISACLVAWGWRLIIKKERDKHKKVMILASAAAILFFTVYMSRTIFIGNTSWGGPENLGTYYRIFLFFHITLATIAAGFGITTLLLAYNKKFKKHRVWGKITAIIWFFSASTGICVYILLYILYPGGHTKPVFQAIFG